MGRQFILAAILCFSAAQAMAENCADRAQVVDRLQGEFSEQLTAGGLQGKQNAQAVVEVWASPETGTFTVMMTNAEGISCIMATGTDWFSEQPTEFFPDIAS